MKDLLECNLKVSSKKSGERGGVQNSSVLLNESQNQSMGCGMGWLNYRQQKSR